MQSKDTKVEPQVEARREVRVEPRQEDASVRMESAQATPEAQAAAKDAQRLEVRLITRQKDLALVEWMEGEEARRSWLPAKEVAQWADGTFHATEPARGVPYGDDFLSGTKLQTTTNAVAKELRQRGIWTADDALGNAPAVFGALQAVYGLDVAGVLSAAAAYKREQRK
jgi:hypothetical protein